MEHFIKKFMSKTLSTMRILHLQVHKTTNLCMCCDVAPERTQHLYQCTHKESRVIWTSSVDALRKWLKARNMDPDITMILVDTLLYIPGERNDLTECPNLTIYLDILCILWPSIILVFIPTSLA